jgi:hypothetical protein
MVAPLKLEKKENKPTMEEAKFLVDILQAVKDLLVECAEVENPRVQGQYLTAVVSLLQSVLDDYEEK